LIWDLESAPILGWAWEKRDTDLVGIKQDWYLLSVAWKWLGESRVRSIALPDYPLYETDPTNDLELVKATRDLLDEADIAVGHNSIAFDSRKMRSRMIYHGLRPPSPYREVDTLLEARRAGKFTDNSLAALGASLTTEEKASTGGFSLWTRCMDGDPTAWARMRKYNMQDVRVTESLYLVLQPWIKTHPNMALIAERPEACPKCGVEGQMQARGYALTNVAKRRRYQCQACGAWSQGRKIEPTTIAYAN
jgi:hypothetical protein